MHSTCLTRKLTCVDHASCTSRMRSNYIRVIVTVSFERIRSHQQQQQQQHRRSLIKRPCGCAAFESVTVISSAQVIYLDSKALRRREAWRKLMLTLAGLPILQAAHINSYSRRNSVFDVRRTISSASCVNVIISPRMFN
jgi:hypothetical protein